jgi:uncharacterized glyoxalase superfamily protein PhnB
MSEQPEFYPMPSFPILSVGDPKKSALWYQEALGFQHIFTMPGPDGTPGLVHLRWMKYADVLLRKGPAPAGKKGVGITLNFAMLGRSLDELADRARAHGALFTEEPGDRPWNARDFTVADPDGFALTFTFGPLKTDMTMDELMKNAAKP